MTPEQTELARHALGLKDGRKVSYRNHFVTGPGSRDYDNWVAMVEAGAAVSRKGSHLTGGDDLFLLTEAGARSVLRKGERLDAEDFSGRAPSGSTSSTVCEK